MRPGRFRADDEISKRRISCFADLEYASYKLERASMALNQSIRVLMERYPHLVIQVIKPPMTDSQHPYSRIRRMLSLGKIHNAR